MIDNKILLEEIDMLDSMYQEATSQLYQLQGSVNRLAVVREALRKVAEEQGAYDQLELKLDE